MKQQMKSLVSILILTLVIVALYSSSYIPYDAYISKQIETFNSIETFNAIEETPDDGHYGYMQPKIVDGFSEEPIEGATVVIPETGQKFVTSKDGLTALIQVPVLEDKHFSDISPKPWGEVTLIVYKKGYIEYVLFHTHVWESQTRKGPNVLLFPEVEGERNEPFAIVEGPHRLWVNELVEKFRP